MAKAVRKKPVKAPIVEAAPVVTEVETTKEIPGKVAFSFTAPTPKWATWIFRTEFILNKAVLFWMTATTQIPTADVKEYLLIIGAIDLATWTLARSLGVKKEEIEN